MNQVNQANCLRQLSKQKCKRIQFEVLEPVDSIKQVSNKWQVNNDV